MHAVLPTTDTVATRAQTPAEMSALYQLYFASMAGSTIQEYTKYRKYKKTQVIHRQKIPMLVMGINKRNKQRSVHHS